MFDWRKDYFNRNLDDSLISEYPWLHYRPRKKTAIELANQLRIDTYNQHIYSNKKEISKWDYFLIRSRRWVQSLRTSLTLETKHLLKPRNLLLKTRRLLQRIRELLVLSITVGAKTKDSVLFHVSDRDYYRMSRRPILIPLRLDTLVHSDRLDISDQVMSNLEREGLLPKFCSDCGNDFINRWRHPEHKDLHYICHLIENEYVY